MNIYAAYHALSPAERQYYEQIALQTKGAAWVDQFKQYYNQYARDAQAAGAGGGGSAAANYAALILSPAVGIGARKAGLYLAEQIVGPEAADKVVEGGTKLAQSAAENAAFNSSANAATTEAASKALASAGVSSAATIGGQTAASLAASQAAANAAGIGTTSALGLSSGGVEGLNAVASGPTIDAANMTAQAGADAGSSTLAGAAPVLQAAGALAGGYGLYKIGENWGAGDRHAGRAGLTAAGGAASGAAIGSFAGPIGTIVGAVLGGIYGFASKWTKSGKHQDQTRRDGVRAGLEELGFAEKIDGSHHVRLMDGGLFDIGRELEEVGVMGDTYNIDLTSPEARRAAGLLTPLAVMLTGTDPDDHHLAANLAGYLTNAAMTQEDPMAQVRNFYEQLGIDHATGFALMSKLAAEGKIDEESHVFMNDGLNQLFDANYTPQIAQEWWMQQPDIPEYAKTIDGETHPLAGTKGNQFQPDAFAPQQPGYVSQGPSQQAQADALARIEQSGQQPQQAQPQQPQMQPQQPNAFAPASPQPAAPTEQQAPAVPPQDDQQEDMMSFRSGLQRLAGHQSPGYKSPTTGENVQPVPRPTGQPAAMPEAHNNQAHNVDLSFLPEQYREQVMGLFPQSGQAPTPQQQPNANSLPPYMELNDFYKEINQDPNRTTGGPLMSFGGFMGGGDNRPDMQFLNTYYQRPVIDQPGPNYGGVPNHPDFQGFQGGSMADAFRFYLNNQARA